MREIDFGLLEASARNILIALGEDPNREGIRDTPKRYAKALAELVSGHNLSPDAVLARDFPIEEATLNSEDDFDQMIVMRNIPFTSTCEHHMLPFIGKATVGYLPGESRRVVGASKLVRLVEMYARRLQIQEQMTKQIANALHKILDPVGAGVVLEATHYCMVCRGVRTTEDVKFVTCDLRGAFRSNPTVRAEFMGHGR